jgi:hypothetical protein
LRRRFVPNPVLPSRTVFAPKCKPPLSLHTRYDPLGRLVVRAADTDQDGTLDAFTDYFYAGGQVVETRGAGSCQYV